MSMSATADSNAWRCSTSDLSAGVAASSKDHTCNSNNSSQQSFDCIHATSALPGIGNVASHSVVSPVHFASATPPGWRFRSARKARCHSRPKPTDLAIILLPEPRIPCPPTSSYRVELDEGAQCSARNPFRPFVSYWNGPSPDRQSILPPATTYRRSGRACVDAA